MSLVSFRGQYKHSDWERERVNADVKQGAKHQENLYKRTGEAVKTLVWLADSNFHLHIIESNSLGEKKDAFPLILDLKSDPGQIVFLNNLDAFYFLILTKQQWPWDRWNKYTLPQRAASEEL